MLEGDWRPGRLVVVEFPSTAAAKRWWGSPDYASLRQLRQQSTTTHMLVVEGAAPGVTGP